MSSTSARISIEQREAGTGCAGGRLPLVTILGHSLGWHAPISIKCRQPEGFASTQLNKVCRLSEMTLMQ
jgi:hypothetical protein